MLELSEKIKEHFRNLRNAGEIENPEGLGSINNPICGDITKYLEREGEAEGSSRANSLIPQISGYYKRGEETTQVVVNNGE
jgi:hypothetical protein